MIRQVHVNDLPERLPIPRDLERKIQYDACRGQLSYDGFMSKATFDRLYRLAEDRNYRRALEELFQLCTFEDADSVPSRATTPALCAGVGLALVAAAVALAALLL